MNRQDIEDTVLSAMEVVLKRPLPDGLETVRATLPEWDSLKHLELMFVLEDELGIEFSEDELSGLNSVARIVEAAVARHAA